MKRNEVTIPLHKPSFKEMLFFLICGAVLSIPLTLFIEQYISPLLAGLDSFSAYLLVLIVLAPLIEEFSKVFPLFYRHGETQRSIFNLALLVGLGFGIVEYLTYVFALNANPIGRLYGLLFHPATASITAYGIATKKPLQFYLVAVALHFSNNFLAVLDPFLPTSAAIVVIAVLISWQLHGKTKNEFIETPYCQPIEGSK
jgi:RsiW-degrading membrane proteinase PrsW (M82 family)